MSEDPIIVKFKWFCNV